MRINLTQWVTESRNLASANIDTLSTIDMLTIINQEDQKVALAVQHVLPQIANAVDLISHAFLNEGRLIYMGAGTSGRLGILDASECPPTFGSASDLVQGLIAGGQQAIFRPIENAEDNTEFGERDLKEINFSNRDVLVGIAASGRTPYVIGGMAYAASIGAKVIALICNPDSLMAKNVNIVICPVVGPEIVTGSSRMKAGTAQKLVLNMLTTGAMIQTGKVFGNLMVDVQASNAKLMQRQINIVVEATSVDVADALTALNAADNHCKTAIVMLLLGINVDQARNRLLRHNGFIRDVLKEK